MDRLGNILKQRLAAQQSSGTEHPTPDLLAAFAEHQLGASEQQRVLSHLALCPACRQTIALGAWQPAELQPTSTVPTRIAGKLPLAMRWASAVAALAVAVGVGAIFYEHHENGPPLSAREAEKAQVAPQSSPVASATPQSAEKDIAQAAPKPPSKTKESETMARQKGDAAGRLEGKKTQTNSVAGGLIASSSAKSEQSRAQMEDAFVVAGKAVNVSNPADIAAFESKPGAPANAPPPPLQVQSGVAAQNVPQLSPHPSETVPRAQLRRSEVSSNGGVIGETALPSQPGVAGHTMKQVATPAIGGSVGPRATFATSLAHWTISNTGKLQRVSQNGGSTAVEPAPGVTVRAVAAQGIEVWAGGSQPDLSAPRWQERPVLFHSSDAGENWTKIDGPWQGSIQSLALGDLHSLTLVTSDGRWTTIDAGKSWARK